MLACLRHTGILLSAALIAGGCATTTTETRPPAQIEVQDEVGFTITEEARIDGNTRAEYEAALILLQQGRFGEGIAILEAVTAEAPDVTAPRIDLGIAHHRAGNLEAAEQHLERALELNPDHPTVHNELGIIYRKTGRFDDARRSYQAALEIYPGYHYARRNLAVLCDLYLADLKCALANYQAYMATVPGDDQATMWISDIESRLDR